MSSLARGITRRSNGRIQHHQDTNCGTITIEEQFDPSSVTRTSCSGGNDSLQATFQNDNPTVANVDVTWSVNGQQIGTDAITIQPGGSATATATPDLSGLQPGTHNVSVDASVEQGQIH